MRIKLFRDSLILPLLLFALPPVVKAQDRFIYTDNGDGTIVIQGYTCTDPVVIVPETIGGLPVTRIGDYAFQSYTNLSSLTMGSNVTQIGRGAFSGCTGLTSIVFSKCATSLGDYAFSGCSSLTHVTLDGVTSIGVYAFWSCASLTSVTMGSNITEIGMVAFYAAPACRP